MSASLTPIYGEAAPKSRTRDLPLMGEGTCHAEIHKSEMCSNKPHAVCIPAPAQGFRITYVNTEFNHRRLVKSQGPESLYGLPDDFRFETIPDGLPDSDEDATQDLNLLADSVTNNLLAPFVDLIKKLNNSSSTPPVTCIFSDGFMPFTTPAAQQLGIPVILLFTFSASSTMGYMQYPALVERGLAPLKDERCFTNGFLDQEVDWIPGMVSIRLRDLPNNFVTTNPNDAIWNLILEGMGRPHEASAIVIHTFDALEPDVLHALSSMSPLWVHMGGWELMCGEDGVDRKTRLGTGKRSGNDVKRAKVEKLVRELMEGEKGKKK
ncbi:hypothetical protein DVH24_032556 [Malus domestica]|uniref:Uncharacterized protein n=1 Tax=Malus domestica TaxID=3750 RepID=A0A498J361_MALDO|nr:hypothetical protein DVH24_032556 [Malus domestica]